MKKRRSQSLNDTLIGLGLLLSLGLVFGFGCFEAFKIFAIVPSAFDTSPFVWTNPTMAGNDDYQPSQFGGSRTTSKQRAAERAQAGRER